MENAITVISTGTDAWAPLGMSALPTFGSAPKAQHQGSGLPFAGYAQDLAVAPTAVRTADAKVPDPRGRQR